MPRNIETLSIINPETIHDLCFACVELDNPKSTKETAPNYQRILRKLESAIKSKEMGGITQQAITYAFEEVYQYHGPTPKVFQNKINEPLLNQLKKIYQTAIEVFDTGKRKNVSDIFQKMAEWMGNVRNSYELEGINLWKLGVD